MLDYDRRLAPWAHMPRINTSAAKAVTAKRASSRPPAFTAKRTVDLPLFRSAADYRRFRQLVASLFRLETIMSGSRRKLAERFGLGLSHHQILTAIAEQQGLAGVSVRELAGCMRVSGPFIAAESKVLADRGLVTKADDPADRRRSLLRLSARGERYVDSVADLLRPVNNRAFRSLDAAQLAQLESLVAQLVADGEAAERLLDAP